jgi:hypothetical protein
VLIMSDNLLPSYISKLDSVILFDVIFAAGIVHSL